jgi:DNA-binding NarL/FixJ family response regulator
MMELEIKNIHQSVEVIMTVSERWKMYYKIQSLKDMGLNVSQIARKLDICRNTVYVYLNAIPEDIE